MYAYESGTGLYERFSRTNGRSIENYAGAIGDPFVLIAYKSGGRYYSPVATAVYVSVRAMPSMLLDAWPSASIPGEICDDLRRSASRSEERLLGFARDSRRIATSGIISPDEQDE